MKIAYLVVKNILWGGGIEKYTYELGSRLAKRGHDITVFSMRHYGPIHSGINGMRIIPVFSSKKEFCQKLSASLSASIKVFCDASYEIVHLHSVASGAFGFLPRSRGLKTVLQMHGIEWRRDRWGHAGSFTLKLLERISLRQSTAYTAVSKTQCEYFLDNYNCRMEYIPTATEIKKHIEARDLYSLNLQPDKYILFASRLVSEKGAHFLISAFKKLKTDIKLVIAGQAIDKKGYTATLKALANNDSRILFAGFVEGRLLEELFSHAYLYIQPSIIEGLSIALLEAMSYGKCCLVSNIPENMEAIGNSGFFFENRNIDDLAEKINYLICNPLVVESANQKALDRVKNNYTWDIVTDRMETFYEGLIRGSR